MRRSLRLGDLPLALRPRRPLLALQQRSHRPDEVFRSANSATSFTNKLHTSQIALPPDVCQTVYAGASGYAKSVVNLSRISFATDGIFSDGHATQLATLSGSVAAGYAASLVVGVAG